ncbi:MAG: hypothetical protein M4D80_17870 [Myxococcota bacterium]|nr:hypothetical protein [Deltaproteobacteria bacterium]MDQ3337033.1 hypothetical protein [Myxococcota bacterium]
MRNLWVGLVLLAAACKAKEPDVTAVRPDGCLALPNAPRHTLRADPNGDGLYWFERVMARDYDGADISYDRLVRYDHGTKRTTVVLGRALGPLHFTKTGDPLAIVKHEYRTLVHIRDDGYLQSLTPSWFDVSDVEPIDRTNLSILAGADSKTSVYLLDLDRPRPAHLMDADMLLSAVPRSVFARHADKGYAVDIATGRREERDVPATAMPDKDLIYFVDDRTVMMRSLRTNEVTKLLDERRDWKLLHQAGAVIARAFANKEHHAYLLSNGTATRLPLMIGGTSIVGTSQQGDTLWGLVGHNTANYDGDFVGLAHESDVCMLDVKAGQMQIQTRTLPARYAAKETEFWRVVAEKYPTARWQILDGQGYAPSLSAFFAEDGGNDLGKLRDRAREVHKSITSMFGDQELVTELLFEDGRHASYRWRREPLRGRAHAGIGDLKVLDPADFDLDISELVVEKIDNFKRVKCEGKLTNLRTVTLVDLQIRCIAGDLERVISIEKIEPKQTLAFKQTFEAKVADYLVVEVFRGREVMQVRDKAQNDKVQARHDFFVKLHAETGLAERELKIEDQFFVQLQAPAKARVGDVDLDMVKKAYEQIDAGRAVFDIDPELELELELELHIEWKRYAWDGEKLTPID